MTLQELGLTDATIRKLNNAGIDSAERLTEMYEEDVIKVKGIGRKALDTIFYRMDAKGLFFKDCENYCKNCACFHKMYKPVSSGWLTWYYCTVIGDEVTSHQEKCEYFIPYGKRPIKRRKRNDI